MEDVKFYYFDSRGFGEVSRLMLALAGQEYQDVRFDREAWAQTYKAEAPFGQGPFLAFTDSKTKKLKKIGQSSAIACFLAREFGLYGSSNQDGAVIDQVVHLYRDMVVAWQKVMQTEDADKKTEENKKLMEEEFPKFFGHFNKLLEENSDSPFFVGNSITLADVYIYDVIFQVKKVTGYDPFTKYPGLQTLYDQVAEIPNIKAYVAKRKDTNM